MLTVEQLAEHCSDAYSTDRYRNGWVPCVKMLRKRGYDDQQIEAILRSKWTRWAADSDNASYGSVPASALGRFLDSLENCQSEVEELTRETFA